MRSLQEQCRIEEADAEVHRAERGHLGVGAGNADGGNAGSVKGIACGDGDAGAVGAEDQGHAAGDQRLRSGGRLVVGGGVVSIDKLHIIGGAADFNSRGQLVCILHAQHFLLAAGAVVAGLGLEHTDLDDGIIGIRHTRGTEGKYHDQGQG